MIFKNIETKKGMVFPTFPYRLTKKQITSIAQLNEIREILGGLIGAISKKKKTD